MICQAYSTKTYKTQINSLQLSYFDEIEKYAFNFISVNGQKTWWNLKQLRTQLLGKRIISIIFPYDKFLEKVSTYENEVEKRWIDTNLRSKSHMVCF